MRERRVGGFTLIELLVVVGIIALLIAILLPALQRAMAEARKISCASTMGQWATAVNAYSGDWEGQFPTKRGRSGRHEYRITGSSMMAFVREYLGANLPSDDFDGAAEEVLFHCPTSHQYRGRAVRISSSREEIHLGYFYWPNVRSTSSAPDYYVDLAWQTREMLGTRARDAPILSDVWATEEPTGDPFEEVPDAINPQWNAHRDLSGRDDDHPGGINGAHEDGSVRWTEADEVLPGLTVNSHSHFGHWRYNVPYSGLEIYPDGDGYEHRTR